MNWIKKSILQSIFFIIIIFVFLKDNINLLNFILGSILSIVFIFIGNYFELLKQNK